VWKKIAITNHHLFPVRKEGDLQQEKALEGGDTAKTKPIEKESGAGERCAHEGGKRFFFMVPEKGKTH